MQTFDPNTVMPSILFQDPITLFHPIIVSLTHELSFIIDPSNKQDFYNLTPLHNKHNLKISIKNL